MKQNQFQDAYLMESIGKQKDSLKEVLIRPAFNLDTITSKIENDGFDTFMTLAYIREELNILETNLRCAETLRMKFIEIDDFIIWLRKEKARLAEEKKTSLLRFRLCISPTISRRIYYLSIRREAIDILRKWMVNWRDTIRKGLKGEPIDFPEDILFHVIKEG